METMLVIVIAVEVVLLILAAVNFIFVKKGSGGGNIDPKELSALKTQMKLLESQLSRMQENEIQNQSSLRQEINNTINNNMNSLRGTIKSQMDDASRSQINEIKAIKESINQSNQAFSQKAESDNKSQIKIVTEMRDSVNTKLSDMNESVSSKLNSMNNSMGVRLNEMSRTTADKLKDMNNSMDIRLGEMNKTTASKLEDMNNSMGIRLDEMNKTTASKLEDMNNSMGVRLDDMSKTTASKLDDTAKSTSVQLKQFEERFRTMETTTEQKLSGIRNTVSEQLSKMAEDNNNKLNKLTEDNNKQLEKIRGTVDEKLQDTLDRKINDSFKLVSERLEQVYKGLGEMQNIAQGVGDLKKVLSNVKTRGMLGEIQLGAILEEILAPEQYEENVATVPRSSERVEFAVKLPGTEENSYVYLPIDSKFNGDKYAHLQAAVESGDKDAVTAARKELETALKKCAKDIRDKYIYPPATTQFGIMFLPFEGLYAEVVGSDLVTVLQREYNVNVAGPSTMAAMLNSLQMGFKTLAIQKRSGEVWQILGAVKTEFRNFEDALNKTQKSIQKAEDDLEKLVGVRTRQINRKLSKVEILENEESSRKLLDE